MITISDGILTIPEGERSVGFSGDNLHTQKKFFIRSTPESGWLYRLYLTFDDGRHNFFTLSKEEVKDGTFLVWNIEEGHILKSGLVKAQIKAFSSDNEVYHTTSDVFVAGKTTEEDEEFLNSYSEFLSLEKRLNQLYGKMETASAKMPYVGSNGNWFTYDVTSGTYKDSGTSAVVSLDGVKITPDTLDREYWQKLERINVTGYDYFDSIISEKNALNTIYRVEFSGLSPIKTVTGDGSFVGVVSFDRDALLIMNISNGDRWIYKKDSNTLTKPEAYINNKSVTPKKLDRTYWEYAKSSFVESAAGLLDMLTEENKIMRIKALEGYSLYSQLGNHDAVVIKTEDGFLLFDLVTGTKYKFDPEGGGLKEVGSSNAYASDSVVSAGTFGTLADLKAYNFEENKFYKIFTPTGSNLASLLGATYGQYWQCVYWIDHSDGDAKYLTLYNLDNGKTGTLAFGSGAYSDHTDQTYNPESENAQSGKAVAEAIYAQLGNVETLLASI